MRETNQHLTLTLLCLGALVGSTFVSGGIANGQALLPGEHSVLQPVPQPPPSVTAVKQTKALQPRVRPKAKFGGQPVRRASYQQATPIQPSFAQQQMGSIPGVITPTSATALPGHANRAIAYFGSGAAAQTLATIPQRVSLAGRPSASMGPPKPRMKPFSTASNGATVSPYLNLYRDELNESAPNYFAFVRPQLNQQEMNRKQQTEMQNLQRQLQRAPANSPSGNTPSSGHRTRYMDTGGYFSGVGQ